MLPDNYWLILALDPLVTNCGEHLSPREHVTACELSVFLL